MKKILVALLTLACTACAPVVTKVSVPDMGKSDSVTVSDMRPTSEKDHQIFSLMITSKEYGIWRVGDARLSPSPVRLLQYQIAKQSNAQNGSPQVAVYHFVVYSNMKSQLRHGAAGAAIGGVAGALIGDAMVSRDEMAQTSLVDEKAFDGMSADEYKRGLYTQAEDPNKASVYIVYIDTSINGKRIFTRTIAPATKQGENDPLVDAVQLAIRNQLTKYNDSEANAHS
ncbi:hypothetical protein [Rhodanobacter sp. C03]|uniref:hypothetical protein n=1 Tax=Rhodanobacter sp. C03 TaxID=1945858 RepID=UPI0011159885|nr:hypothetical protein [Rhodanobacter sp. C03]